MFKRIFAIALLMAGALLMRADLPFRTHRFDSFKVLEIGPENIVFLGNSITNMHPWTEAFGNPRVINRGNSGAVSDELIDNIDSFTAGQPAKIFLMIGTNDLGTEGINDPQRVADNVQKLVSLIQQKSPRTEIFVQSILPSEIGLRTLEAEQGANAAIRDACERMGATYIDLWDDLKDGILSGQNSLDGLHLAASAYRIWCSKIAPLVGSDCMYAAGLPDMPYGLGRSYGMRSTYFSMLPVYAGDVLFFGDEMMHGCEWNELLHCPKIKNRGTGWGYRSIGLKDIAKCVPAMLIGNGGKETPAKIFIYAGAVDAASGAPADTILADYKALVDSIRDLAPCAKLYAMSLAPMSTSAETNADIIRPFNASLEAWAGTQPGIEYIDIYTALADGELADSRYVWENYLMGLGYAKISEILAPYLTDEGATPTTEADALRLIELHSGSR